MRFCLGCDFFFMLLIQWKMNCRSLSALLFWYPSRIKKIVLLSLSVLLFWYPKRMKNIFFMSACTIVLVSQANKKKGFIITVFIIVLVSQVNKKKGFIIISCIFLGILVCVFVWVPQAKEKWIFYPWLWFVWYVSEIITVHLHCIINQTTNLFGRI